MTTVEITDVCLRDGLQDEPVIVTTEDKLRILDALVDAGVRRLEIGSFVNPRKVPQMADSAELFAGVRRRPDVMLTALALNTRGVERAVAAGADEVSIVLSASEAHSSANAGQSVDQALERYRDAVAAHPQVRFIGGISTAFRCPFEGEIDPQRLIRLVEGFRDMGITTVGLADTLGTTPPDELMRSLENVRTAVPDVEYSLHLHNAHGQALETVTRAVDAGIMTFDAAVAGYGGCPFAPGAHGNIATEELVSHLHRGGITTGIDLDALTDVAALVRGIVASARPLDTVHTGGRNEA